MSKHAVNRNLQDPSRNAEPIAAIRGALAVCRRHALHVAARDVAGPPTTGRTAVDRKA